MTQLNLTLDQEELLELLSGNREVAFKHLIEKILNSIRKEIQRTQLILIISITIFLVLAAL